jgi:hypothetical protein
MEHRALIIGAPTAMVMLAVAALVILGGDVRNRTVGLGRPA